MSLPIHFIIYVVSFVAVWFGAGLVVNSVVKFAHRLHLPAFLISFFLLGNLTSLPEIAIGLTSISTDDPIIYAGNLLGGTIVIFFLIIPLLALAGKGIKIPNTFDKKQTLFTLVVCFAPALLIADQHLSPSDGILLILLYCLLFLLFSEKASLFEKMTSSFHRKHKHGMSDLVRIVVGVILLFVASRQIVNSTLYFAEVLSIPSFILSLVVISIGTNIPEISLVIRSVLQKKEDVAFADYLGSASANTLLFGVFTLIYGKTVILPNHFLQRFLILGLGLILFYFFARSKKTLSKVEALALLSIYIFFVWIEISLIGQA